MKTAVRHRLRPYDITPDGNVFKATGDNGAWYIPIGTQKHARWAMDFLESHERFLDRLSPGDTVIEVGAATGEYTVPAAEAVSPGGMLYTFEAEPNNRECLRKNLQAHGVESVVRIDGRGVSDTEADEVSFGVSDSIADHLFDPETKTEENPSDEDDFREITVETTTIDEFCDAQGIERIEMLKLTANGHEPTILEGARGVLDDTRYVFMNYLSEDAEAVLDEFGFVLDESRSQDAAGKAVLYENPTF